MGRLISSWYREGEVLARDARRKEQASKEPLPRITAIAPNQTNNYTLARESQNDGLTRECPIDVTHSLEDNEELDDESDDVTIGMARREHMGGVRLERPRLVLMTTNNH